MRRNYICATISGIIFKIKISCFKMIPVVVIVSRLSVTLSSQFFETSDCTPPDPDYEFRNVPVYQVLH